VRVGDVVALLFLSELSAPLLVIVLNLINDSFREPEESFLLR
jgi:hypothetical protein